MKSRNLFGGAIVAALLVGIWFGSFFKGFGLGENGTDGNGPNADTQSHSRTEVRAIPATGVTNPTASTNSPSTPSEPDFGLPAQFITIVIHNNQFRLMTGDAPSVGPDISLEEVKRQAADTIGTPEGIRVRILKAKSAQEGARADLLAALIAAGVKREAIQERADFINLP